MKKLKMYLDTSVIGGSFDDEFKEHSTRLVDAVKQGKIIGVVSEITIREILNAPDFVKLAFEAYVKNLEVVRVTEEMTELAECYIRENIITGKFFGDAMHIACATVYQVDLLVSWNFKHIVNYNKISRFNAVNLMNGYKTLQIFSPMEVSADADED